MSLSAFSHLLPGDIIGERFEVLSFLGQGGFATVYRAKDTQLGREVAVKVLRPLTDETASERFHREAHLCCRLEHPNVVRVYSYGLLPDGAPYMVQELVEGISLEKLLDSRQKLEPKDAVLVMRAVLDGIGYAHRQGVIHRDLKPDNILVSPDLSEIKVADFGLARSTGSLTLTQPGFVVGTPAFMSPEQLTGNPVDARSDLYTCGCIFAYLLAGSLPFAAQNDVELCNAHLHEEPRLQNIPKDLAQVISVALEKKTNERYQTANEFLDAISEADINSGVLPATRTPRTTATANILVAACSALLVIASVVFFLLWYEKKEQTALSPSDEHPPDQNQLVAEVQKCIQRGDWDGAIEAGSQLEADLPHRNKNDATRGVAALQRLRKMLLDRISQVTSSNNLPVARSLAMRYGKIDHDKVAMAAAWRPLICHERPLSDDSPAQALSLLEPCKSRLTADNLDLYKLALRSEMFRRINSGKFDAETKRLTTEDVRISQDQNDLLNWVQARSMHGFVLTKLGQLDESEKMLDSVTLAPRACNNAFPIAGMFTARYALARAFACKGELDRALQQCEKHKAMLAGQVLLNKDELKKDFDEADMWANEFRQIAAQKSAGPSQKG